MQINLLEETTNFLRNHGHVLENIKYCVIDNWFQNSSLYAVIDDDNISQLKQMLNVNYDNGYGMSEITRKLKLCGKDFWIERAEYDGSEWWEYKTMPDIHQMKEVKLNRIRIKED